MTLAGQVALVTGAGAPRLGRAIALGLAARGADVAVHYHASGEGAREAVAEIEALGRRAVALDADLRDPDAARALPGRAAAALGRLDILIASAAAFPKAGLADTTVATWDDIFDLNLRAPFLLAQAAAPLLRAGGRGRIVAIADAAGRRPWPSYLAYSVSKAGLLALVEGLARALAPEVTVNAVAPGLVLPAEAMTEADRARALARVPLGRPGSPGDVVEAVLYLVERAPFTTGAVLPVDGGRIIG